MSVNNLFASNSTLWSIRAVDISGNYNQKLNFDASGNAIVRTGNTDRLTIDSGGAWTCQGGMTYNNVTNTLTAGTFSGAVSGTATTATNIAGGAGGELVYQSAASTTALLANGTAGQVLTSQGTTLAPTWTTPSSGSQTLSQVLTTGNSAGSTSINMNSQNITAVNNLTVASPYNFSVISIFANSTARDAALPSPYTGQICFLTGTNALQYYNAGWFAVGSASTPVLPTISGFTLGSNYEIIYVNSGNAVIGAAVSGGFTIVRFYPTTTTSGTLSLSQTTSITYLVVGGGGGGGGAQGNFNSGGGGGAGGYLSTTGTLNGSTSYAVSVGGGGAGGSNVSGVAGTNGTNSSLAISSGTITATGGGGGGGSNVNNGSAGGSGGGGASGNFATTTGGAGSQGNAGAGGIIGSPYNAGGGGGSSGAGNTNRTGGDGTSNSITGTITPYAGGGGGGTATTASAGAGGTGGGGNGGWSSSPNGSNGTNGLGGGGGGGYVSASNYSGGNGGSGIVVVRFPSFI